MSGNNDDDIMPSIPLPRSVALQPISQSFLGVSVGMASDKESSKLSSSSSNKGNNKRMEVKQDHENQLGQTAATPTPISSDSWRWKITHLSTVPMFHPLECTSVLLKDLALDEISARISNFMRLNSIASSYRSDLGRVDCLTSCLLKFSVQLWRSVDQFPSNDRVAASNNTSNVIIEVSRMQGCAIGMQHLRNGLLYAVMTGMQPELPLHQQRMGSKCPSRVLRDMYEQYVESTGSAHESHCKGALLIAIRLLESDCVDQNKLGMESLSVLSNPSTVCESEADWIAKAIIFGDGEYGAQIQSVLTKYFQKTERPEQLDRGGLTYDSDDDESGFLLYAQGCRFGIMHNHALQVLTHSLERLVARKSDHYDETTLDTSGTFWETVLTSLVYNLKVAQYRPHEACHSARCLAFLNQLEPMLLEFLMEDGLSSIVAQAHEFGKMHHLTLERESGHVLTSLTTTMRQSPTNLYKPR